MSMNASWHPKDGVYKAEARHSEGAIWVTLEQDDVVSLTFFFTSHEQADAVAAAFNGELHLVEAEQQTFGSDLVAELDAIE